MADLTLERIAELRRSQAAAKRWYSRKPPIETLEDAQSLRMLSDSYEGELLESANALLDAAERGLTGGWVKNGPLLEKPEGSVLLWRSDVQAAVMGEWSESCDEWHTDDTDAYGDVRSCGDGEISHFMVIKEPTDAQ